ncbi:hypothetical protein ES703_88909 [subsurface metagenome]
MNYWLGVTGMWCLTDAIFSISIYLNKPGYNGQVQTWRRSLGPGSEGGLWGGFDSNRSGLLGG